MSNLHKMISTNLGNSRAELDELGGTTQSDLILQINTLTMPSTR